MDLNTFVRFLKAVRNVNDEATLWVEDGRLRFCSMDPGHVILTDLAVAADGCDVPEPVAVNVADLVKLLRFTKGDVKISVADKRFAVEGASFRFVVNTLSNPLSPAPKPHLTYTAELEVTYGELYDVVHEAGVVSDYIRLATSNEGLDVYAKSDYAEFWRRLKPISMKVEKETKASFSLSYLSKVVDIVGAADPDKVTLLFATDRPIVVRASGLFDAEVFLAPRVE